MAGAGVASGGGTGGGVGGLTGGSEWLASAGAARTSCDAGDAASVADGDVTGAGSNSSVTRASAGVSGVSVWRDRTSVSASKQAACARNDSVIVAAGTVAAR